MVIIEKNSVKKLELEKLEKLDFLQTRKTRTRQKFQTRTLKNSRQPCFERTVAKNLCASHKIYIFIIFQKIKMRFSETREKNELE